MIFQTNSLVDSYIIDLNKIEDNRGFFSRLWCFNEFKNKKINFTIAQINNSFTKKKFTLRGLHFQYSPFSEGKLVRCISGSIYDVIVDLRPKSQTYKKWFGIELSSNNRKMLYAPKGFAHGFLTLEDATEVIYFVSEFYKPEIEDILLWNDKTINIQWPNQPKEISEKDKLGKEFIQVEKKLI